jgi:beta-N-acetylhexosaminidase
MTPLFVGIAIGVAAARGVAAPQRDAVDRQIDAMTPDQRVAQLLFVGFEGTRVTPELRRLVGEIGVGGIVLYAHNIGSPEQVRALNDEILATAPAGRVPFIAVDQEGGRVERLKAGVPRLPGNMALGAARSPALARRAGRQLAERLRALGFSMNFAPVVDVLADVENPALGARAFSNDPHLVAALATAFIEGQSDALIASVAKHFPGEGAARGDPHYELPVLDRTRRELEERELIPFRAAIAAGVPAVMTSHVVLPRIAETRDTPATLSAEIITRLLREELRYDGIVITDELEMQSVRGRRDPGELAVRAILSGADMLLTVWSRADRDAMLAALRKAYANGTLGDARLRQSLRRILRLRRQLAVRPREHFNDGSIEADIATASMTLYRRDDLPLIPHSARLAFVGPAGALRDAFPAAAVVSTPPRIDDAVLKNAIAAIGTADLLVAAIASATDRRLYSAIRERFPKLPTVLVVLDAPFAPIGTPRAILFAYDDGPASQSAAVEVLAGRRCSPGVLPIATSAAGVTRGYIGERCVSR